MGRLVGMDWKKIYEEQFSRASDKILAGSDSHIRRLDLITLCSEEANMAVFEALNGKLQELEARLVRLEEKTPI